MKFLTILLFLSTVLVAQTPDKVFTFNLADAEHCKVIVIDGKPLLESTFEGTSIAIAMPVNKGNGEFLLFVAVTRVAPGAVHVDPKEIYGLFPDAAHSRFTFFDKATETDQRMRGQSGDPGLSASNAQLDPGSVRPGQMGPGGPPPGGAPASSPGAGPDGTARSGVPTVPTYIRQSKVKQGNKVAGWVVLRQPKGLKVDVHSTDVLDEIDIPMNGIVFRF
jgi:hypothetical protein